MYHGFFLFVRNNGLQKLPDLAFSGFIGQRAGAKRRADAAGCSCGLFFVLPLNLWSQDTNAAVLFGQKGDVNLYRAAAGTLQTDGNLVISGSLQADANVAVAGNITAGPSRTNLVQTIAEQTNQISGLLNTVNSLSGQIRSLLTTVANLTSQLTTLRQQQQQQPFLVSVANGPGGQTLTITAQPLVINTIEFGTAWDASKYQVRSSLHICPHSVSASQFTAPLAGLYQFQGIPLVIYSPVEHCCSVNVN